MLDPSRRDFIKSSAIAATAAAGGIALPEGAAAATPAPALSAGTDGISWDKGVCRFCGTGCGVLVGTKGGKVVVTLEDDDTNSAADRYVALHGVPGVASVAMVYQYSDDELDTEEVEA